MHEKSMKTKIFWTSSNEAKNQKARVVLNLMKILILAWNEFKSSKVKVASWVSRNFLLLQIYSFFIIKFALEKLPKILDKGCKACSRMKTWIFLEILHLTRSGESSKMLNEFFKVTIFNAVCKINYQLERSKN